MKLSVWLPTLVALGFLLLIKYLYSKRKTISKAEIFPYLKKNQFTYSSEVTFYKILESLPFVQDNYYVFPQVNLDKIIDILPGYDQKNTFRNKIDRKSVDFVLVEKQSFKPVLAIELNGSIHDRVDKILDDVEKTKIIQASQLPLLTIKRNDAGYSAAQIANDIQDALQQL